MHWAPPQPPTRGLPADGQPHGPPAAIAAAIAAPCAAPSGSSSGSGRCCVPAPSCQHASSFIP
jgi:hypothetical protein